MAARWPAPRPSTGRVALATEVGGTFDRLWARTHAQADFTLVRSRAFLDWLVFRSPKPDKTLIAAYDSQGEARGFLILEDSGASRLQVLDLWCEGPSLETAADLIRGACAFGRKRGFDTLWAPQYVPFMAQASRSAGFCLRRSFVTPLFARRDSGFSLPSAARVYWTGLIGDKGL